MVVNGKNSLTDRTKTNNNNKKILLQFLMQFIIIKEIAFLHTVK